MKLAISDLYKVFSGCVVALLLSACGGSSGSASSQNISEESSFGSSASISIATEETEGLPTVESINTSEDLGIAILEKSDSSNIAEKTGGFDVVAQFPEAQNGRVVQSAVMSVTFAQDILVDSFDPATTISVRVRDTGAQVEGVAELVGTDTITFTPNTPLAVSTIYAFEVTNTLASVLGDVFLGQTTFFATLFDVGNTSQEVVNECGNRGALLYLGHINSERNLSAGSTCARLGFTQPVPSMSLSCELVDIASQAAESKANSFNPATGGFNVAFNYGGALAETGLEILSGRVIQEQGANTFLSISSYFRDGIDQRNCDIILDENFTHFGGTGVSVDGFFGNQMSFHELLFVEPL